LRRKPGMIDALREITDIVVVYEKEVFAKGFWQERFRKMGPLQVELGIGKGQFLRQMAQLYPDRCFIGIEKEPGILLQAVRKTREAGLENLQLVLCDVQFLPQLFAQAEIDVLYINFCDPWPKSRHQKRRLTHQDFLRIYQQLLTPTGLLRFKTDDYFLFEFSLASFISMGMDIVKISTNLHSEKMELLEPLAIMTEYEAKFVANKLPIYYCEALFGKSLEEGCPRG